MAPDIFITMICCGGQSSTECASIMSTMLPASLEVDELCLSPACVCSLLETANDSEIHIASLSRTINPEDKINHLAEAVASRPSTPLGERKRIPESRILRNRCLLTPAQSEPQNKRFVWFGFRGDTRASSACVQVSCRPATWQ